MSSVHIHENLASALSILSCYALNQCFLIKDLVVPITESISQNTNHMSGTAKA